MMSTMGPSRYEPHYAPGGHYWAPDAHTIIAVGNDAVRRIWRDLREFDMARLATWLEEWGYTHGHE
jgi:hypothetical protein